MDIKNKSGFFFILSFLLSAICGCYPTEHFVAFTSDEITRLISADTSKSWEAVKLVNNGIEQTDDPCSINLIKKFSFSKKDQATHLYEIYKNPEVCNGADTLIESGEWYVIEGSAGTGAIDTLAMILSGDTLKFSIQEITSTKLELSGKINDSLIDEDLEWYIP